MKTRNHGIAQQRGITLVTSLVLLVLLTIIGVSTMQRATLEERMSGNTRDRNLAFQAAEAALRSCEAFLNSAALPEFTGSAGSSANSGGLYQPSPAGTAPVWLAISWSDTTAVRVVSAFGNGTGADPRCVIEELPPVNITGGSQRFGALSESAAYRITALGYGGATSTTVMLQSSYLR